MSSVFTTFPRGLLTRSSLTGRPGIRIPVIILFILVFLPQKIAAQESGYILFHGVLFDADTRQPLTGAHYQVMGRPEGATDSRGMFAFYARHHDTIIFTSVGYKEYLMIVPDTLHAREYVTGISLSSDTLMIPAVVVIPRIGNIRAELLSEHPEPNQEIINATNNLKISAYQGLTSAATLGDPASNYEVLRQQQRADAYEKGQISSGQMLVLSPLTLIPLIYILAVGLPEEPQAPVPYISAREMESLRALHDSLIYRSPRY